MWRQILKEQCNGNEIYSSFQETLSDCIFDVCHGGGEAPAELAAEILNVF